MNRKDYMLYIDDKLVCESNNYIDLQKRVYYALRCIMKANSKYSVYYKDKLIESGVK